MAGDIFAGWQTYYQVKDDVGHWYNQLWCGIQWSKIDVKNLCQMYDEAGSPDAYLWIHWATPLSGTQNLGNKATQRNQKRRRLLWKTGFGNWGVAKQPTITEPPKVEKSVQKMRKLTALPSRRENSITALKPSRSLKTLVWFPKRSRRQAQRYAEEPPVGWERWPAEVIFFKI